MCAATIAATNRLISILCAHNLTVYKALRCIHAWCLYDAYGRRYGESGCVWHWALLIKSHETFLRIVIGLGLGLRYG